MDASKLILIVEDDEFIREAIMELLQSEGYRVDTASNGQLGIDYLKSAKVLPSIVLLDLMMPVKDGYTFRDEQLSDSRLNKVPVLVMSADPNMLNRKDRLQAQAYLKKPLEIVDMLKAIEKLVS